MSDLVPYSGGGDVGPYADDTAAMVAAHAPPAALQGNVVVNHEDWDAVRSFQSAMSWAPESFVRAAVKWYTQFAGKELKSLEQADAQRIAQDRQDYRDMTGSLRAEWGTSYNANRRAVQEAFASLPPALQEVLQNGELNDGTYSLHSKAIISWLLEVARKPKVVMGRQQAVEDELSDIKELMAKRNSSYWVGPRSASLQARYVQLLHMRDGT